MKRHLAARLENKMNRSIKPDNLANLMKTHVVRRFGWEGNYQHIFIFHQHKDRRQFVSDVVKICLDEKAHIRKANILFEIGIARAERKKIVDEITTLIRESSKPICFDVYKDIERVQLKELSRRPLPRHR